MRKREKEEWRDIPDFPGYKVSNLGYIWSDLTRLRLNLSQAQTGAYKVNLMREGHIQTRIVRVLVAEAFVPIDQQLARENVLVAPINLDGNQANNAASNLMWRPRWFAWKYTRQFNYYDENGIPVFFYIDIVNERTGHIYHSVMEAGIHEGLLWDDVYESIISGKQVYPTGSSFNFLDPIPGVKRKHDRDH